MAKPKSFFIMRALVVPILFSLLLISSCGKELVQPRSPDGRISLSLGHFEDQAFTYSIYLDGKELVGPSAIMLEFQDQEAFGGGLDLEFLGESFKDESWNPLWGKSSRARNRYREYTYRLAERTQDARYLDWIIRVYDDGVAFRYSFPEDSGFGEFKLTREDCQFTLDPAGRAWATNHEHYYSSQEHPYDERPLGEITEDELIGCPLLVEVKDAGWLLITEADLTDWAGMYFRASENTPGTMVTSLASLWRDQLVKVEGSCPAVSPWRVIMVGTDPGTFIESDIIANLNDPV